MNMMPITNKNGERTHNHDMLTAPDNLRIIRVKTEHSNATLISIIKFSIKSPIIKQFLLLFLQI